LSHMATRTLPCDSQCFDISAAWRAGDDRNPRIVALRELVLNAIGASLQMGAR